VRSEGIGPETLLPCATSVPSSGALLVPFPAGSAWATWPRCVSEGVVPLPGVRGYPRASLGRGYGTGSPRLAVRQLRPEAALSATWRLSSAARPDGVPTPPQGPARQPSRPTLVPLQAVTIRPDDCTDGPVGDKGRPRRPASRAGAAIMSWTARCSARSARGCDRHGR
jgi:hypothetical protein